MELGWIDYSEESRERTLAVLAALQEPTAIDELGVGIVRDAFADFFFPTTSTLFTKAKYLFFVPYALRDMERENNSGKSAAQLRKSYDDREKNLAIELLKANAENTTGIIGARSLRSDFSGHWVKRGPAVIYWAALRNLGFCRNPELGYSEYFRTIAGNTGSTRRKAAANDADKGWNDDDAASKSLWHVPDQSYAHWHSDRSMQLNAEEAGFLAEQVDLRFPGSLYSLLMRDPTIYSAAARAFQEGDGADDSKEPTPADDAFTTFAATVAPMMDAKTAGRLEDAVAFGNFVYLCRIRYNAQLPPVAEEAKEEWRELAPLAGAYAQKLDVDRVYERMEIWKHAGAQPLYRFLTEAKDAAAQGDVTALDECVRRRERSIKHERAKIGRSEGLPENWRGGRRLSYRFEVAESFAEEVMGAGAGNA